MKLGVSKWLRPKTFKEQMILCNSIFTTLKPRLFAEDCGSTDPPAVSVLGGWAKQNTVGIVAASSRTGRIFCHTRAVNGSMPFQVTAEEVQQAPWHDLQEETFATGYSHDSV